MSGDNNSTPRNGTAKLPWECLTIEGQQARMLNEFSPAQWLEDEGVLVGIFQRKQGDRAWYRWKALAKERGVDAYGYEKAVDQLMAELGFGKTRRQHAAPQDGADEPATDWHDALLRNRSGTPQQTINNFVHAVRHLEPWCSDGYWYDVVRERHMIGTRPVEDVDATTAGVRIEQDTEIRVTNIKLVGHALEHVCRETARDLLHEWVETLPAVPVTDLLTTWLRTYAHVSDLVSDAYVADVSRTIPVGIIARILTPGCQYRYVPVLEGPEEAGKSKLTKALAGHDPYGQSWHVALSSGMETKEAHMMLEGALIAELEELSSYTKTDENRMKALISAETDSFVPKFSNKRVDHPRRTVFIATVNPEADGTYFRGQSGNSRYLPLAVRDIDIPGFLKIRTRLFAEAKAYVEAHPGDWWKLDCEEDARVEREQRRQTSVYEGEELRAWLKRRNPAQCTWQEVAELHLMIPKDRWNKALQMEIGKALRAEKWIPGRTKADRYWMPGYGEQFNSLICKEMTTFLRGCHRGCHPSDPHKYWVMTR